MHYSHWFISSFFQRTLQSAVFIVFFGRFWTLFPKSEQRKRCQNRLKCKNTSIFLVLFFLFEFFIALFVLSCKENSAKETLLFFLYNSRTFSFFSRFIRRVKIILMPLHSRIFDFDFFLLRSTCLIKIDFLRIA